MNWITIILGFALIALVIISLWYVTKVFLLKKSLATFRMLLLMIFFELWTISRIILIFNIQLSLIRATNNFAVLRIGNAFLVISILIMAFLFTNPFFGEKARFFAFAGYSMFSGLGILILYDFFNPTFFRYTIKDQMVVNEINSAPIILTLIGLTMMTISYLFVMRSLDRLPEMLYVRHNKYWLMILPIVGGVIVLFLFVAFFSDLTNFNTIFTVFMNVLFHYTTLYLLHQPYIQFNLGLSPRDLVEQNYVGYILGALTDVGPDVMVTSDVFNSTVGIDEIAIYTLNLGGTTVMGMNESFANKIAIIPVPHDERLSAIIYAFRTHYQDLNETKEFMTTPAVLAIIIPSVLLINMNNVLSAQRRITTYMEQYSTIELLQDHQVLKKIVTTLLGELTF